MVSRMLRALVLGSLVLVSTTGFVQALENPNLKPPGTSAPVASKSAVNDAIEEWVRSNLGVPRCPHVFAIGNLGIFEANRALYAVAVVCEGTVSTNAFLWVTRSNTGRFNISRADEN